jgi:hypothetical protein
MRWSESISLGRKTESGRKQRRGVQTPVQVRETNRQKVVARARLAERSRKW